VLVIESVENILFMSGADGGRFPTDLAFGIFCLWGNLSRGVTVDSKIRGCTVVLPAQFLLMQSNPCAKANISLVVAAQEGTRDSEH